MDIPSRSFFFIATPIFSSTDVLWEPISFCVAVEIQK